MNTKAVFTAFVACVLLVLAVGLSYMIGSRTGYRRGYQDGLDAPGKVDTVTVVDTHFVDRPVPQYVYVDKPVYVPVHDTTLVHHNDTTWIQLPREVKGYADSTYRCEVSGVQPSLDWIEVYKRTQTVTKTVVQPAPRWSFGVTAGPALLWNHNGLHGGIGATVGLQYRF